MLYVNKEGTIHVHWLDGSESDVLPSELYVLDRDNDEEPFGLMDGEGGEEGEEAGSDSEWETASDVSDTVEVGSGGDILEERAAEDRGIMEDIITRSLATLGVRESPATLGVRDQNNSNGNMDTETQNESSRPNESSNLGSQTSVSASTLSSGDVVSNADDIEGESSQDFVRLQRCMSASESKY